MYYKVCNYDVVQLGSYQRGGLKILQTAEQKFYRDVTIYLLGLMLNRLPNDDIRTILQTKELATTDVVILKRTEKIMSNRGKYLEK